MLFLQPLVAVACGPHAWELLPNSRYREKRLLFESYYYCINKITGRPEKRILFCRRKWTKYQIWALVVRLERFEFFQSMQSTGIPPHHILMFTCPLCISCRPQMMSIRRLPGEIQLSWEAGMGRSGECMALTSAAYPWLVWNFAGNCKKKKFKFTQGGECKGRLSTSEPLVKAERLRGKKKH